MSCRIKKPHHVPSKLCVRLLVVILLTTTTLPLGACTSSQLGAFGPLDTPAPGGALITVRNVHVQDMRVYLLRGTTPILLGTVGTLEERTFAVSTAMLGHSGTLRLQAHPIGSRNTFTTPLIQAAPGDLVRWKLGPSLALSTYRVTTIVR